ncbi:hypothetical protein [Rheinheimera pleomorphica]|nr:hypothetical protein [Rheinheimera pleomorphica]
MKELNLNQVNEVSGGALPIVYGIARIAIPRIIAYALVQMERE